MVEQIRSIDAHCGGAAVRLLSGGVPSPQGRTMGQKRDWMRRHADWIRRALLREPRGVADMVGCLLTEPGSPSAHAGMLFMDAEGYPPLSGAAVIAAVTIAVERRLLEGADLSRLTLETPAGTVHAAMQTAGADCRRVETVAFTNVPSFVAAGGHHVTIGQRSIRLDIASSGLTYAIVDSESIGIPLTGQALPELRRFAGELRAGLNRSTADQGDIDGVIFTGPPTNELAHLRSAVLTGPTLDRSASPTGTAALMAVLDAMGLLDDTGVFVHESLTGALLHGRISGRTQVGDRPAIIPVVEGSAWITGEHTFILDDADPLREGFLL